MKKILLTILLCVITSCAYAKPHSLTWQLPTTDCDGVPLFGVDFIEQEIIYDTSPMPMPSDSTGPCFGTPDPDAPPSATVESILPTDTVITLNLQPGQTYYARARVSAYVNGNWSAWSTETQFTVPYGRPNKIQFTKWWERFEYYEIGVTSLNKKT